MKTFLMMVALLVGATFLPGCKALEKAREHRQERKAVEYFATHPEKDARRCAENYPVQGKIEYRDSVHRDTIDHYQDTGRIREYITTYYREKAVQVVDSALTRYYRLQLEAEQSKNRELEKGFYAADKAAAVGGVTAQRNLWISLTMGLLSLVLIVINLIQLFKRK